jgi:hypothetical protein
VVDWLVRNSEFFVAFWIVLVLFIAVSWGSLIYRDGFREDDDE